MASRGDIQKQLSNAMALARGQGYKLEEVIPTEMQDHFHDMAALKDAQAYIKEADAREQQLKDENANLASQLQAQQSELDNQPAEFKALKVDLEQAELRIGYFQKLARDSDAQATRYQRQRDEGIKSRNAAEDAAAKIQRLERDLADREATVLKFTAAIHKLVDDHEAQRERDLALVNEKEDKIVTIIGLVNQLKVEKDEAVADIDTIFATSDSITKALEEETTSTAAQLNDKSLQLQSSEQLYAAVASELTPLNAFYANADSVLAAFQALFQNLSDPACTTVLLMPTSLDKLLDATCDELEAFQQITTAMQSEGLAQDKVRSQLKEMAKCAGQVHASLDLLYKDVGEFLNRLRVNNGQLKKPRKSGASISSLSSLFRSRSVNASQRGAGA